MNYTHNPELLSHPRITLATLNLSRIHELHSQPRTAVAPLSVIAAHGGGATIRMIAVHTMIYTDATALHFVSMLHGEDAGHPMIGLRINTRKQYLGCAQCGLESRKHKRPGAEGDRRKLEVCGVHTVGSSEPRPKGETSGASLARSRTFRC